MELELRFEDSFEFLRIWERIVVFGGLKFLSDVIYELGMLFLCIMVGMFFLVDNGFGIKFFFCEVWVVFEMWIYVMGGYCLNL